jgi:hypothetical protein
MLGRALVVLTVLMLAAPIVWTADTSAQTKSSPAQAPAPAVPPAAPQVQDKAQTPELGGAKQVEGTIQKLAGNTLTLSDGTELMLPSSLQVQRDDLKAGASVKASYEDKGGQKVVTSIQVQPAK